MVQIICSAMIFLSISTIGRADTVASHENRIRCSEFIDLIAIAKSSHFDFADRDPEIVFKNFMTELPKQFEVTAYAETATRVIKPEGLDSSPPFVRPPSWNRLEVTCGESEPALARLTAEYETAVDLKLTSDERNRLNQLWPEVMLKAFLHSLDPHSYFVGAPEVQRKLTARSGKSGVLAMNTFPIQGRLIVVSVNPKGPAYKAGVRRGDRWMQINGFKLAEECQMSCLYKLADRAGDFFPAVFQTPEGALKTVLMRKAPMGNAEYGIWVERRPGSPQAWLRLDSFYSGSGDDLIPILSELERSTDSLVLDLTSNLGGQETDMVKVLKAFLGSGVYGRSIDRHGESLDFSSQGNEKPVYTKPILVLVDRRTVSSAEYVAGVLQVYSRALIVGSNGAESTYGKGNSYVWHYLARTISGVQLTYETTSGGGRELLGELGLTHRVSYLPNGKPTQGMGVIPDVILPSVRFDTLHDRSAEKESDIENALKTPATIPEFMDQNLLTPQVRARGLKALGTVPPPPFESLEAQTDWLLEFARVFASAPLSRL